MGQKSRGSQEWSHIFLGAGVLNTNGVTARVNYHCVVLADKATRVATVIKVDRSAEVL